MNGLTRLVTNVKQNVENLSGYLKETHLIEHLDIGQINEKCIANIENT